MIIDSKNLCFNNGVQLRPMQHQTMYERWECLMCNKLSMKIEVGVQRSKWQGFDFGINRDFASQRYFFMCIFIPLNFFTLGE
jgi:hypothetical protein